jgi:hypothetical protein
LDRAADHGRRIFDAVRKDSWCLGNYFGLT